MTPDKLKRIDASGGPPQVLCDARGALNREAMANLVGQVAGLVGEGRQMLLVTSGAVAAGSGAGSGQKGHHRQQSHEASQRHSSPPSPGPDRIHSDD